MEIEVSYEEIKKSRLVTFDPPEDEINICPECSSWWYLKDMPKHNSGCKKL